MGSAMGKGAASLLDSLPPNQSLHVVMLGLDSAGKTTALYRLKFDQYLNTTNCAPLWRSYTRCTDGVVFVLDSVDEERMEEARLELQRVARENPGVPLLVLANKQDLPGAKEPRVIERLLGLHELSASHLWHVQPACAIIGEGLDDGLERLYDMIVRRRRQAKQAKRKPRS
ncbi:hypothetical protein MRX96_031195 [Rhipicephalus microplus]